MTESSLYQLEVKYDSEQDRILFRANTSHHAEMRAWITRAYLFHLWPVLIKALTRTMPSEYATNPIAKGTILAFQQEEKTAKVKFNEPFSKKVVSTPLGSEPLLLTRIKLIPGPHDLQTLGLFPSVGQGIQLTLDDTLLHSLCKVLTDVHRVANWNLDLSVPGSFPLKPQTTNPRNLN